MNRTGRIPALASAALALVACACSGPRRPPGAVVVWIAGHEAPRFDPDGPPDALRWAIERQLSRGLVDEDTSGRIVPAAAESITVSRDRLSVRFKLRTGLAFTDGHPCTSEDFRLALRGGLARTDHATRERLLAAVTGMPAVRAGRKLPPLGIETPDVHTLVLRLARPDSLLLRKLSVPGVSTPWRRRTSGSWQDACGLGPYRVATWESTRLVLTRRGPHGRADTLRVRFVPSAARAANVLRSGRADLVWPIPPALLEQPVAPGFELRRARAAPERELLLVLRGDVPPTTKLPARGALAHAINRSDLASALGAFGEPAGALIPGAPRFEAPAFDAGEVAEWMTRGDLGRSFHVAMAYDAGGAGASAARALQGDWSRLNMYVELRPQREPDYFSETLSGQSQLLLLDYQPVVDSGPWRLGEFALPLRGPAVGAFRSGWRTREFDPWIEGRPNAAALQPAVLQGRIEEEMRILPLARLPWVWLVPASRGAPGGGIAVFHPHYGPDFTGSGAATGP